MRLDHRDPAVRPVLDCALPFHPRDREWISLHGAYPDPVCLGVSRCVCAREPHWRLAEYFIPLDVPARWLSHVRHRLCLVQGCRSEQTILAGYGACGHRPECRLDGGPRLSSGISLHSGRSAVAPRGVRLPPFQLAVALLCWYTGRVAKWFRPHRALAPSTNSARSLVDGRDVPVLDRGISKLLS